MSIPSGRPLSELVKTAQDITADALYCFEVYNALRTTSNRKRFSIAFKTYSHFFSIVTPSIFYTLIISLYKIGEKRDDTVNIDSILNTTEFDLSDIKPEFKKTHAKWIKVCIIRNKLIGHASASLNIEEVFLEAGITPKELEELAEKYLVILNKIAQRIAATTASLEAQLQLVEDNTTLLLTKLSEETH